MELKVGGVYKVRDGRKAWVLEDNGSYFSGVIVCSSSYVRKLWYPDGKVSTERDFQHEIVSEWREPRTEKVYVCECCHNGRSLSLMHPDFMGKPNLRLIKTVTINLEDEE